MGKLNFRGYLISQFFPTRKIRKNLMHAINMFYSNIRSFTLVPVTALLVYLFQLVPVIFTYLRADCPCDVTTFLDLTSFKLLTGSGRIGSQVKNHDLVPSLGTSKE